jgi:hypothetical protein
MRSQPTSRATFCDRVYNIIKEEDLADVTRRLEEMPKKRTQERAAR